MDNSYPRQLVPGQDNSSCSGYKLSWVRVVLGTSCPGYELSWVRVVVGTSCRGYELSWVRVVQIPKKNMVCIVVRNCLGAHSIVISVFMNQGAGSCSSSCYIFVDVIEYFSFNNTSCIS